MGRTRGAARERAGRLMGYAACEKREVGLNLYVCSRCKGPLAEYRCANCRLEFTVTEGIPCFLTASGGGSGQMLREVYDDIYRHHQDVWVDQGRSADFLGYFRELTGSAPGDTLLEVGCGEGMLLAALNGGRKYGIDPSLQALLRARKRSAASCAVARAEELPFPPGVFDLVVAVGVMEHFEDPDAATAEIRRVLKSSGRYVALIQTDMTRLERLAQKAREYLFPRFRPVALLKWARKKLAHRIVQPLRRSYTVEAARACLERNGLEVTAVVTRRTQPGAPLAGDHVVILLSRTRPPQ
jgi:ubiquinone/menaquinone biosynthesis C-methylase UbiE